jgi:hypothetical protein
VRKISLCLCILLQQAAKFRLLAPQGSPKGPWSRMLHCWFAGGKTIDIDKRRGHQKTCSRSSELTCNIGRSWEWVLFFCCASLCFALLRSAGVVVACHSLSRTSPRFVSIVIFMDCDNTKTFCCQLPPPPSLEGPSIDYPSSARAPCAD